MLTIDEPVEIILLCERERYTPREMLQQTLKRCDLNGSHTVSCLLEKFKITGSVADTPRSRRPSTSTEAEETVLAKVLRVMQHMTEDDPDHCVEMCICFLKNLEEEEYFLSKVVFSDEENFYANGKLNRQIVHYWFNTNPLWLTDDKEQSLLPSWFAVVYGNTKSSALNLFKIL
ncbi:hypothetical protein PR048_011281 [Dryococelus australis]|uniref:Uncharacterized protein n=1 Tax=Dryococelus australis TaxID=614101 RepID=A0ABQ9HLN1_9NEOP|nr:hypothetical protein PR048_011281 [Dryococelus australis]